MKNLYFTLGLFSVLQIAAAGQTSLAGIIIDRETQSPITGATVNLFLKGKLVFEIETDAGGRFLVNEILPGIYTIEVNQLEYQSLRITKFNVLPEQENLIEIKLDIGLSLNKIFTALTRKPLQKADRKLRKFIKSIPKKAIKRATRKKRKQQ